MLIKLNSAVCGHRKDKAGNVTGVFSHAAGDEVDWHDDKEAVVMIERGLASEVKKTNK